MWAKDPAIGNKMINARSETLAEKPSFRSALKHRRCLVPATAFCEPDEGKPARWHWFALKADEPRPLFADSGALRTAFR